MAIPSYVKPVKASEASLSAIRNKVIRARQLTSLIVQKESELKKLNDELTELTRVTLPEMFNIAGTNMVGIDAHGILPAILAERKPYYRANIAANWEAERRAAAFKYLESRKAGDLIRNIITVTFGAKSIKAQKLVTTFLNKSKLDYEAERSVPWASLTSWLRAEVEAGRVPKLDLIGGDIGEIVTLKLQEKK